MPNFGNGRLSGKAKFFRGFSDLSRLRILEVLRKGPHTVNDIVRLTQTTQPNVSNHLKCLRECGLVTAERDGRYIHYHLSDDRVGDLLYLADALLDDVARGVYRCERYRISAEEG